MLLPANRNERQYWIYRCIHSSNSEAKGDMRYAVSHLVGRRRTNGIPGGRARTSKAVQRRAPNDAVVLRLAKVKQVRNPAGRGAFFAERLDSKSSAIACQMQKVPGRVRARPEGGRPAIHVAIPEYCWTGAIISVAVSFKDAARNVRSVVRCECRPVLASAGRASRCGTLAKGEPDRVSRSFPRTLRLRPHRSAERLASILPPASIPTLHAMRAARHRALCLRPPMNSCRIIGRGTDDKQLPRDPRLAPARFCDRPL